MVVGFAEYFYLKDIGMEREIEITNIKTDEIIKIFKEEEGVELNIEEAEIIASFLKLLLTFTIKRFLDK